MKDFAFTAIVLLLLLFSFGSCTSKIEGDSLDKWVRANDFESIRDWTYNKRRLNSEKLEKVIKLYSEKINEKGLRTEYIVDNSIKKLFTNRERLGYEYYDEDDNLHYSITYKLITMPEDSSKLFNYIDFRATDGDLPSVKAPLFGPIRSIYSAENLDDLKKRPETLDSLRAIGDLDLHGYKLKHVLILGEENKMIPKDSVKSAIVFNINNNWVKQHIDLIIPGLAKQIDISKYNLAYMETVSTPTLRLGFDAGFDPRDLLPMMKFFEELTNKRMIVAPSFKKEFELYKGNFYIGHSVVDKKKIRF